MWVGRDLLAGVRADLLADLDRGSRRRRARRGRRRAPSRRTGGRSGSGSAGEAGVAGELRQRLLDLVGDPEVEDRVHHPRHAHRGAGADRDQQRTLAAAELAAELFLEAGDAGQDRPPGLVFELAAGGVEAAALLDRQAQRRRHRQARGSASRRCCGPCCRPPRGSAPTRPSRTTTRSATAVMRRPRARSRRLLALAAKHAQQVLVQLEPDRVVAVDADARRRNRARRRGPCRRPRRGGSCRCPRRGSSSAKPSSTFSARSCWSPRRSTMPASYSASEWSLGIRSPPAAGIICQSVKSVEQLAVDPLEALVGLGRGGVGAELGVGLGIALVEPLAAGRGDHEHACWRRRRGRRRRGLERSVDLGLVSAEHRRHRGRGCRPS